MIESNRTLRPDHQLFDEIIIRTVPRYKTSDLSGDEWRISAVIEYRCKGKIMHSRGLCDIKTALDFAKSEYWVASDNGRNDINYEEMFCDQEGCLNKWTKKFILKSRYCKSGHKTENQFGDYRAFCDQHHKRGDCGLDDADDNYEYNEVQVKENIK